MLLYLILHNQLRDWWDGKLDSNTSARFEEFKSNNPTSDELKAYKEKNPQDFDLIHKVMSAEGAKEKLERFTSRRRRGILGSDASAVDLQTSSTKENKIKSSDAIVAYLITSGKFGNAMAKGKELAGKGKEWLSRLSKKQKEGLANINNQVSEAGQKMRDKYPKAFATDNPAKAIEDATKKSNLVKRSIGYGGGGALTVTGGGYLGMKAMGGKKKKEKQEQMKASRVRAIAEGVRKAGGAALGALKTGAKKSKEYLGGEFTKKGMDRFNRKMAERVRTNPLDPSIAKEYTKQRTKQGIVRKGLLGGGAAATVGYGVTRPNKQKKEKMMSTFLATYNEFVDAINSENQEPQEQVTS